MVSKAERNKTTEEHRARVPPRIISGKVDRRQTETNKEKLPYYLQELNR